MTEKPKLSFQEEKDLREKISLSIYKTLADGTRHLNALDTLGIVLNSISSVTAYFLYHISRREFITEIVDGLKNSIIERIVDADQLDGRVNEKIQ